MQATLPREMSIRKPGRIGDFVEQISAPVSERADVDLLKADDVTPELDDDVRDRSKRPACASIDEEYISMKREVIEYVPRRSRAEKQVPRQDRECRIVRRQGNRSLWRID